MNAVFYANLDRGLFNQVEVLNSTLVLYVMEMCLEMVTFTLGSLLAFYV